MNWDLVNLQTRRLLIVVIGGLLFAGGFYAALQNAMLTYFIITTVKGESAGFLSCVTAAAVFLACMAGRRYFLDILSRVITPEDLKKK